MEVTEKVITKVIDALKKGYAKKKKEHYKEATEFVIDELRKSNIFITREEFLTILKAINLDKRKDMKNGDD